MLVKKDLKWWDWIFIGLLFPFVSVFLAVEAIWNKDTRSMWKGLLRWRSSLERSRDRSAKEILQELVKRHGGVVCSDYATIYGPITKRKYNIGYEDVELEGVSRLGTFVRETTRFEYILSIALLILSDEPTYLVHLSCRPGVTDVRENERIRSLACDILCQRRQEEKHRR
jgi:hypothetical protein